MGSIPAVKQLGATPAASTASAVIRVEDAHKYYELGETRVHALRGVSLEIQPGEFVAIMGASGSGKSTFMNMLGCLDRITSGRYFLEGIDVSSHGKKALALVAHLVIGSFRQTRLGGSDSSSVRSVPAVVVDGPLASCCAGRGPEEHVLESALA